MCGASPTSPPLHRAAAIVCSQRDRRCARPEIARNGWLTTPTHQWCSTPLSSPRRLLTSHMAACLRAMSDKLARHRVFSNHSYAPCGRWHAYHLFTVYAGGAILEAATLAPG